MRLKELSLLEQDELPPEQPKKRPPPPKAKDEDVYQSLAQKVKAFLRSGQEESLLIIYGKPGTGKSFTTEAMAIEMKKLAGREETGSMAYFTDEDADEIRNNFNEYATMIKRADKMEKQQIKAAEQKYNAKNGIARETSDGESFFEDMTGAVPFKTTPEYTQLTKELAKKKSQMVREWIVAHLDEADKEYYEDLYKEYQEAAADSENTEQRKYIAGELNDFINSKRPQSLTKKLKSFATSKPPFRGRVFAGTQNPDADRLYLELYKTRGDVIIYDDSNKSFFDDPAVQDVLLHAGQTKADKTIFYSDQAKKGGGLGYVKIGNMIIPDAFAYSGKVIIITNRDPRVLPENVRSRAELFPFNPTAKQMLQQTATGLEGIKAKYKSARPKLIGKLYDHIIDEVFAWLKANVGEGSVRYDMRLFDKLVRLKREEMYSGAGDEDFDAKAKSMIRQFYKNEKDVEGDLRKKRIRGMIGLYQNQRRMELNKSQRSRVNNMLAYLSTKELENVGEVFKRIDAEVGNMQAPDDQAS